MRLVLLFRPALMSIKFGRIMLVLLHRRVTRGVLVPTTMGTHSRQVGQTTTSHGDIRPNGTPTQAGSRTLGTLTRLGTPTQLGRPIKPGATSRLGTTARVGMPATQKVKRRTIHGEEKENRNLKRQRRSRSSVWCWTARPTTSHAHLTKSTFGFA